jgi:UDP-N-acetylmuramyl pentapeptide phosphotransferase/UDP-N-acetylglucosamine-1-phosphate transferase
MLELLPEPVIIAGTFLASLIITLVSIPSIVKVAKLKRLYDSPDERRIHQGNVPTLGGLAVFSGFSVSILFFADFEQIPELKFILAGVIILFFVGIKDDILIIAPLTKLMGQIFAASLIVLFTDLQITNFHGFFGINEISQWIGIPLSIFVFIVIINGFNLIDGIDGLSASIGVIVALTLGIWFYMVGAYQYVLITVSIIGALIGLLRFNVYSNENKIILGDTGSLIVGLLISVPVIKFNEMNIEHDFDYSKYGAPAISIAILVIPLFDTVRVMFIRFFQGKPIFKPDKQHIHHVFIRLGLSHKQAVLILVLINILFAVTALEIHNLMGIRRLFLVFLLAAMIIFYIPTIFARRKEKRIQKKNL